MDEFNPTMGINSITVADYIQVIPEPTGLALVTCGATLAVLFRRRHYHP
jgi:hypothetical protein